MATHLNHLIQTHAAELLGRQEVQQLLDQISQDRAQAHRRPGAQGAVAQHAAQGAAEPARRRGVSIRDMRTILDVMAEHAPTIKDATELTTLVRLALGRAIVQQLFPGETGRCRSLAWTARSTACCSRRMSSNSGIEPGIADNLLRQAQAAIARQEQMGLAPCSSCSTALRVLLVPLPAAQPAAAQGAFAFGDP
jgi:flagellar biosynthesis protein FlhA